VFGAVIADAGGVTAPGFDHLAGLRQRPSGHGATVLDVGPA